MLLARRQAPQRQPSNSIMRLFTFGSLFAGIGGLDLGLERAGMTCKWQVENDGYCQRVLSKHWPNVTRYSDVHDVGEHNLEAVDLICGGFPCQPVSLAGKRQGQADPRWLWPEFARIIAELRPRYVLVENVPGLYSQGFGDILVDLAKSGYDAEWDCIPAAAFGAPHLRYRVFVVAHSQCKRFNQKNKHQKGPFARCHWLSRWKTWSSEPDVGRVAYGISDRVAKLRALGNAIVPQVAEWIGSRIMAGDENDDDAERRCTDSLTPC